MNKLILHQWIYFENTSFAQSVFRSSEIMENYVNDNSFLFQWCYNMNYNAKPDVKHHSKTSPFAEHHTTSYSKSENPMPYGVCVTWGTNQAIKATNWPANCSNYREKTYKFYCMGFTVDYSTSADHLSAVIMNVVHAITKSLNSVAQN